MNATIRADDMPFEEAVRGFLAGDFSRLAPLFERRPDGSPGPVIRWFDSGAFASEPEALAEAFSCACFNGHTEAMEHLLARGVDPSGGIATGMNAFHWAANRGQLKAVEILIRSQAPLEALNSYGGTVLGCAVWSAIHETKPQHPQVLQALVEAGADMAAGYPSGDERIDEMLRRFSRR